MVKYWVVCVAMALPLGVSQGFTSTLYSNLKTLQVTQDQAAWLGFWMTMAGCAGAVVVGAEAMCAAALCACLVGATADRRSVFGQCFSNLTLTFAAAALASLVNAVFCAR